MKNIFGLRLNRFKHGFQRVQLLKILKPTPLPPDHLKIVDIVNDKVEIPEQVTTYWCKLIKLPDDAKEKQHIIRYEGNIQPGNEQLVHHIEVYHCQVDPNEDLPAWDGSCFDKNMPEILLKCKKVISAWAMGAGVSILLIVFCFFVMLNKTFFITFFSRLFIPKKLVYLWEEKITPNLLCWKYITIIL